MENCPTCGRGFDSFRDFPFIFVDSFKRINIPADVKFPYEDPHTYLDSPLADYQVPNTVVQLLQTASEGEGNSVEFEGRKWWYKKWYKSKGYRCSCDNEKSIILESLEPYLKRVEGLIGKTIATIKLLPNFDTGTYYEQIFVIPNSHYKLFLEDKRKVGSKKLRQIEFFIAAEDECKHEFNYSKEDLIGELKYRGKLKKKVNNTES